MNNWFIAKLIFGIHQPHQTAVTQFDEQLRLIKAKDKLEALLKARMIGIKEEHVFTNDQSGEVHWEFVDVVELRLVDEFKDGMELCSRIEEHDSADSYTEYVKHRGQLLLNQIEDSFVQSAAV